jgi:hypothetical protein
LHDSTIADGRPVGGSNRIDKEHAMTHVSRTFLPGLLAASLGLCMAGTAFAAGNDSNPSTSQQLSNPPASSASPSDRQGNGAAASSSTAGDRSAMGGNSATGNGSATGSSTPTGSNPSSGSNASSGNGSATGSTTSAGSNSSMGSSAATGNAGGSGKEATARNIFEQLDANHDGQLSFEEFSRATFQQQ